MKTDVKKYYFNSCWDLCVVLTLILHWKKQTTHMKTWKQCFDCISVGLPLIFFRVSRCLWMKFCFDRLHWYSCPFCVTSSPYFFTLLCTKTPLMQFWVAWIWCVRTDRKAPCRSVTDRPWHLEIKPHFLFFHTTFLWNRRRSTHVLYCRGLFLSSSGCASPCCERWWALPREPRLPLNLFWS